MPGYDPLRTLQVNAINCSMIHLLALLMLEPAAPVIADDAASAVVDPAQVRERIAAFDRDVRDSGIPGRVRSCRLITEVSLGRDQSNQSYGGICSIEFGKRRREYLLCNDRLVGHFALAADFVVSGEWVERFVKSNCVGG
ncbi:hypothetical protein [Sphingomonas flavescens]|uniref:hypothetical protein n=1 Tax=Sphingomonas flavescens TaxID=3132797 RepID=UPI002805F3A3|nr:hypothetical protein [Sphingomonas limnosediminicola]